MAKNKLLDSLCIVQKELKAPKKIYPKKYEVMFCKKCGKEMMVRRDYVKHHSGVCMSCQKTGNKQAVKHGDYKTRLYHIWSGLKHRRYNTTNPNVLFPDYESFKEWSLKNGYNDNLTIDRIDNKGDYSPDNCQWITLEENAGKDKKIFTDKEKLNIYLKRKELGLTQIQMAKYLKVSRNTIQRAEKFAHQKGV